MTGGEKKKLLSHLDSDGRAKMVDVSSKPLSARTAVATGRITLTKETVALVRKNEISKGDVIATARLAGIQADFLPHVFEAFRRSEAGSKRAHRGLGIGLSVVRHLVLKHGGRVSATSDGPGQGSQFSVRLPLAQPSSLGPLASP